jgi:hypothetical protein
MLLLPSEASPRNDDALLPAINHLLEYVEDSNCVFIRNDREYDSRNAAKHLKEKYDYFMSSIKTPEDFIELAGSKSSVSGKPYWVRCTGQSPTLTVNWLMKELSDYKTLHSHTLSKSKQQFKY